MIQRIGPLERRGTFSKCIRDSIPCVARGDEVDYQNSGTVIDEE